MCLPGWSECAQENRTASVTCSKNRKDINLVLKHLFFLFVNDKVSLYHTEASLKLIILLPQPLKFWEFRCTISCWESMWFLFLQWLKGCQIVEFIYIYFIYLNNLCNSFMRVKGNQPFIFINKERREHREFRPFTHEHVSVKLILLMVICVVFSLQIYLICGRILACSSSAT